MKPCPARNGTRKCDLIKSINPRKDVEESCEVRCLTDCQSVGKRLDLVTLADTSPTATPRGPADDTPDYNWASQCRNDLAPLRQYTVTARKRLEPFSIWPARRLRASRLLIVRAAFRPDASPLRPGHVRSPPTPPGRQVTAWGRVKRRASRRSPSPVSTSGGGPLPQIAVGHIISGLRRTDGLRAQSHSLDESAVAALHTELGTSP